MTTGTRPYRIILADDHVMFRSGLKMMVSHDERFSVVAEAGDGEELLEAVDQNVCDLAVIDLSMPRMDGMAALHRIKSRFSDLPVLVLTMQKDTDLFQQAMEAEASGYILKDDAFEQLAEAMERVLQGERFVSPSILRLVEEETAVREQRSQSLNDLLTRREQQVLKLVAAGMANKNIARELKISVRTVEVHRSRLMNKLGIRTTAGLVKYALSQGVV
ncbi:MAG: response regulator [Candidatus Omnitrophota bacterium]